MNNTPNPTGVAGFQVQNGVKTYVDSGGKAVSDQSAGRDFLYNTPSSSPMYASPTTGGPTSSNPVVTSSSAQDDFTQKMASLKTLQDQITAQGASKASAELNAKEAKAEQDAYDAEQKLKTDQLSIQKQDSNTQASLAASKAAAVTAATGNTANPPAGWDPQTYANFKAANPGLEPTPEDTQRMQNAGTPNGDLQNSLSKEQSDLQSIQDSKDTVAGQSISLLQQVMSGTIPLTGPQQALITSLQTQLKSNEALQTTANEAYTGAVSESAFRSGGEYTPQEMAGKIQNAVSVGVAKIQALDNEAAKTIADLEVSFQKENYDVINKQYDILTKQLDDKAAAVKDTYDKTTALIKDQRDQQQKITDSVNKIAQDAAKNGATPDVMNAIKNSKTESDAIGAAGDFLQSATGVQGEYLNYKRDAIAKGLTPMSFEQYKYNDAYNSEKAKQDAQAAYTSSDKGQQKLEQQYRQVLTKELSSRSGNLGIENGKVAQANHLNSLITQYYDSKTGDYNIPKAQYSELVLGLANMMSNTGMASDSLREDINTATAAGDINKAISYVTGEPTNGSTQDIIKNLVDSIDRQAETATRNREANLQNMRDMAPTDLSQDRIDKLNKSTQMVKYEGQQRLDKSAVNNYVSTLPKDSPDRENIAKMYEIPGATDEAIAQWLRDNNKIQ